MVILGDKKQVTKGNTINECMLIIPHFLDVGFEFVKKIIELRVEDKVYSTSTRFNFDWDCWYEVRKAYINVGWAFGL